MPLPRELVSFLAHSDHPIACPLGDDHVASLLALLDPPEGGRVLDLGCGQGEWLARLLVDRRDLKGVGVDTSRVHLDHARARRVPARVAWVEQDARAFLDQDPGAFDAVLCAGSTHALGGLRPSLDALAPALAPAGRLLIADGFWERAPNEAALEALGCDAEAYTTLDGTVALAEAAGYEAVHVSTSSQEEWDDYEDAWCRGLETHARTDSRLDETDRAQLLETASAHRAAYRDGYRAKLGFAALILRRTESGQNS